MSKQKANDAIRLAAVIGDWRALDSPAEALKSSRLSTEELLAISRQVFVDPELAQAFRFACILRNGDRFDDPDPLAPGFEVAEPSDAGDSGKPTAAGVFCEVRRWTVDDLLAATAHREAKSSLVAWIARSVGSTFRCLVRASDRAAEAVDSTIEAVNEAIDGLGSRVTPVPLGPAGKTASWSLSDLMAGGVRELQIECRDLQLHLRWRDGRQNPPQTLVAVELDTLRVVPPDAPNGSDFAIISLDQLTEDRIQLKPSDVTVIDGLKLRESLKHLIDDLLNGFSSNLSDAARSASLSLYAQVVPREDPQRALLTRGGDILSDGERLVLQDIDCVIP